jgi:uncharacterized repeat protein (TIGR01451 family)/gliding motility-associated-like protein
MKENDTHHSPSLFRFLLAFTVVLGSSSLFYAQLVSPFTIRHQTQQKGGIRFISNVSVTCNSSTSCTNAQAQMPPSGSGQNNSYTMSYVDIDSDPTTFMSSSDSLNLANCSEITWAGLYWGGKITTSTANYVNRSNIKVKVNNGAYQQLTADQTINNTTGAVSYFCFKNITSIVQAAGIKGRFTIADQVQQVNSSNLFGGWTIVVVYKNISDPYKNLTVFDGLANVSQGSSSNTVTIPISGFLTPLSGAVSFELGVIAYDGDRSQTGDQLLFNGVGTSYVQVSDALHTPTDMFNSTIAYNGVLTPFRNPSYNNTLGYDASIFIPNNAAQNYLNNGATSANIRVTTTSETILSRVITSAVDIYEPDLRATVFVNDLNGGAVAPGDILEYTISGKNIGSDVAVNCFITDTLDIRTDYVPNSLVVLNGPNAGPKTDAAGDDQAEYNSATRFVKYRVGSGASASSGGSMINTPLDSVLVKFQVQVSNDCLILKCDSTLENKAYIFGTGTLSGNTVTNNGTSDVYDAFGCPTSANNEVTISTASCPPVDFTFNDPLCPGDNLQLTTINSPWANYFWSGPQGFTSTVYNPTISNISTLNTGVYELDVTFNGSACTFSNVTNSIVVHPEPTISLVSLSNVTCYNAANGTIVTSVAGGAPITYLWTSGQNTAAISNLSPGLFSLQVTDGFTCESDTSFSITQPDTLIVNLQITSDYNGQNISCFGASDGSISSTVTGGTAPYTYSWNNGSSTTNLNNLPIGTYTLTVTDSKGCVSSATVTLTQPPAIALTAAPTAVLCYAGTNGAVNTTIGGGTLPYTILWSNGQITPNISTLQAGLYEMIVTDANNCKDSIETTVSQPAQPLSVTHTQTDVLCYGEATGAIDITVAGGTPIYAYSWSIGATTEDINGLPIGTYNVQITDANGCLITYGATIQQPVAPLSMSGLVTPISCFGTNIGAVNIAVSGGTTPYTYNWNNGAFTSQNINTLPAGSYSVLVTDDHLCTITQSFVVTQPQGPLALSETHQDAGCTGPGSIDLTTTGGTAPYSYFWSNLTFNEDVIPAIAGTYTVQVEDGNGCSESLSVTILNLAIPIFTSITGQDILCLNDSTGSVDFTVTGGVAPFSFAWSNGATTEDISGLPAGTYTVTVTDGNNCVEIDSIALTQPLTSMIITETHTNANCLDSVAGAINASVTAGTPGYTYSWNNGATTQDISGIQNGIYVLTVTDANGCQETLPVEILDPSNTVVVASTVNPVNCFGGADGWIDLTPSGGMPGYVYEWGTGAIEQDITNLAPGQYYVNVEDVLGCGMFMSFNVTQPVGPLTINGTVYNVVCLGDTNGIVDLTITGGTAPFTYQWNTGLTTQDIYNLSAGTYSVIVTDDNGCTATYSGGVTAPGSALAVTLYPTAALCFGTPTGSIDLSVAGGVPGYTYSWSNGQTSQDLTGVVGGQYTVTVQDANGCLYADTVIVNQPLSALTLTQATTNISCNGLSDGYVNLIVSGGTPGYTYLWNNAATTQDLANVPAGSYSVVVNDANACTDSLTVLVTQPSALVGVSGVSNDILCHGAATGSISAQGTGGTGVYTYLWNNGSTAATLSGVPAGIYSVTVSDNNGCSASQSWTLSQPTPITMQSTNTNILCYGQTSGSISASASGGVAPYTYQWTNGLSGASIVNQPAGPYFVTVTDGNGCTATFSDTIYQPQSALTLTTVVTDNICFGVNAGSIDNTVTGGTAPYNYQWNNSATSQDLQNLLAGTYTVVITDANGCLISDTMIVAQPPQSMTATETHVDVSCFGGGNGSINLTVTGTGHPFIYNWNNGSTAQDISNLVPGVYTVTITDQSGCTLQQSVNITQPTSPINVQAVITDVPCFGTQTGGIDLTVTGGVGPYLYAWSNNSGSQDLTNVIAGNYQVIVMDAVGCQLPITYPITQPSAALNITLNPVQVACTGVPTGQIDLVVTGGTPSYTYAWSNNTSGQDLLGVVTGLYSVVVTDANGCTSSGTTFLTQPTMSLTASAAISGVSCFGGNNGLINVSVVGGTAPYNYLWSNGSFDQDIDTLTAGIYVLEIYDDNGCYLQQSYTVTQSLSPLVLSSVMTPVGCYGGTNGALNLTVVGGTGPYTYVWSNTSLTQDLQNIIAGIYSVTVTDANGCSATLQDTVTQPGVYALTAQITPVACFANNTGAIDLTVIGGTAPYTYGWSNSAPTQDLLNLLAGTYSVVVTDAQGCQAAGSYVVSQPSGVLTLNAAITNASCTGTTTATIDLTVTGGAAPYTYAWNNQAVTEDLASVGVGTYTVTVTDAGGCQGITSVTVTQPAPLSLIVTPVNPLCPNTATGSVDLTVSGGTSPYTYQWSGPNGYTAISEDIGFIPIGLYYVIVTDAYGCSATQTTSLVNPTPISATYTSTPVQCYGGSNGTVDVTVSGGTAPYTYNWSNGAITQDLQNRPAGNDTLIVTDSYGCQFQFITTVSQPIGPLTINATIANIGCFGTQSGNIDITMTGGTPSYTYQWNNSLTTEDLTNVNPGLYSVLVYDANGCFTSDTFLITQVGSPMTLQITGTNIVCFGDNNGTINLTVNGGVSPYQYTWNNGATSQDLSGILAGTYTVNVQDANQCIVATSLTITAPSAPLVITAQEVNLQCFNQNTGAIDVTISGGVQPYSYSWTSTTGFSATTQDISGLSAGGYTLLVTDFNGCTTSQSFVLTQPATQAVISSTVNDILCYGATTGWINASAVGGALPYQYLWLGPNGTFAGTTEDLFGIGAGWYELFVTDAIGCTTSDSILVSTPPQIVSPAQITNISCFGFGNGSIDVTTTGGVQPYGFMWSTGAPSEDLSGLNPGNYTLTVTDANNCVVSTSYLVTQPAAPLTLNLAQVNVSCFADSTGFIDLIPSGGTFPYTYAWSGPNSYSATTEDILNLPIGMYGVVVTDANGCTEATQTTITQPLAPLGLSETHTNVSCYAGADGTIAILAQGGTPSYDYLWNNGLTTAAVSGLTAGTYTVLVSDSLGCSANMSVTLTQPLAPISLTAAVTDLICMNDATGVIDLSVAGGTPGYTYSWSTGATSQDLDSLESGPYEITITDTLGCVLIDTIVVNNPPNPMVVTPSQTNVTCHNYSDGLLILTMSGGLPAYDIQWSTGDTIPVLDSLIAGIYSVLVTDAQGCDEALTFEVTQPQPIIAYFNPSVTFGCVPLSVTFTNNSSGPYTNSLWSFGNAVTSTAQNATTVLTNPGCYDISLIVYNAAGCADTMSMDSLVCAVPGPQASFTAATGGIDYYTGALELNNNSLGAITSNFWTFGDGSPNSVLESPTHYYPDQQPADYLVTLTVTDTNGCVDTASYVFTLIELLNVYVPNSITIDGDGVNDLFLPVFSNVDIIEKYELQIFNRWGAIVWETNTPAEGWNGRYKDSKDVQLGLYNWKIIYTDNKMVTRTIAGHVNVLR